MRADMADLRTNRVGGSAPQTVTERLDYLDVRVNALDARLNVLSTNLEAEHRDIRQRLTALERDSVNNHVQTRRLEERTSA